MKDLSEKRRTSQVIVSLVVGLASAFFWLSPLLFGDYIKHGGDLVSHIRWSDQFAATLFEGNMRPQWLPEEGYGFGKPTFVTYSPAFYYVASAAYGLTGDVWTGIKIALLFFLTMGGFFVHLLLRELMSAPYSVLGTFVTLGSPIIIIVLYNYTGLPAFASFGPLAAVLYFTFRNYPERRFGIGVSFSFFALVLTHILTAAMTAMALGAALFIRAMLAKSNQCGLSRWGTMLYWGIWASAGILLASFYVVPALHSALQGHFFPHEAESAFIDWRRGFSLPVITQWFHEIYWATFQWYVPGIYAFGVFVIYRALSADDNRGSQSRDQLAGLFVAALVAFFFTTELSYGVWAWFGILQIVQWPWRFLIPLGLFVPIGLILVANRRNVCNFLRFAAIACLAMGVLFSGAKVAQLVVGGHVVDLADPRAPERSLSRHTGSLDALLAYRDSGGLQNECLEENMLCEEEAHFSHFKSWIIEAPSATSMRLPIYYYPGWSVTINGESVPLRYDPETGLLRISVAPGVSRVVIEWIGVPIQRISNLLSFLAFALLMVLFVFPVARKAR